METKRDRILAAAFRLFRQHGYQKVTMSDVADAASISRPTLYAEFSNKAAIMSAITDHYAESLAATTATRLTKRLGLKARLRLIFEIWIVEPFAEFVDDANERDLIDNVGVYIPAAIHSFYACFEQQLLDALQSEMTSTRTLAAQDLARVLAVSAKGLKGSSADVAELRRLVDSLIAMAVAAAGR